jgi:hypothetical protein
VLAELMVHQRMRPLAREFVERCWWPRSSSAVISLSELLKRLLHVVL